MPNKLSPHDRVFRATMSKPEAAKEFFSVYLPAHIKKQINLDSLKLEKDSFVDDKLRMQITDLLYATKFGEKQGYLYLLVEHTSTINPLMPFRVLKYMIAVMEHHLKVTKTKHLPLIYPVILYSGKSSYNHTMDLFDLFGNQRKLAEDIFYRPYQLLDLRKISDQDLKEQLWFGVLARIMKHIYSKDILPHFQSIIPELKIIADKDNNDYTYNIISYLFEAGEISDQDDFIEMVKTGLAFDEEKIMTLAKQYEAKGEARGEARGREEVLRQMAINMLNKGMDSKEIAQIANITLDDLRRLLAEVKQRDN